jgi:hypothetical protein
VPWDSISVTVVIFEVSHGAIEFGPDAGSRSAVATATRAIVKATATIKTIPAILRIAIFSFYIYLLFFVPFFSVAALAL